MIASPLLEMTGSLVPDEKSGTALLRKMCPRKPAGQNVRPVFSCPEDGACTGVSHTRLLVPDLAGAEMTPVLWRAA